MKKILLTYLLGFLAMILSSYVIDNANIYSSFRVFIIIVMIASIESVRNDFQENWFSTLFIALIGVIILISGIVTSKSTNLFIPMIILLLISTFKTLKNIWGI